jgi:formate dehydrogenase major subunit
MTNTWMDIKNADVIIVMGGNSAEAHPVGFKWDIEGKVKNKARLIVVDPRFTRTASVADFYCPIRPGTDIAFLSGVIKYLLDNDKIQHEYVKAFTNASFVVKDGFGFKDGLFTGYHEDKRSYDTASWEYEIGDDGFAVVDPTMQHQRCVMQLLRGHVAEFTPELVERITGSPKDKFLKICEMIASTSTPDRVMTSLYALGWTQHSKGSQNIRTMCIIQMLLGNIGMPGGGVNALRGHSNIQGLTDIGLMSELMPGYLDLPLDADKDLPTYLARHQFKPLRPGQTSYWQNYPKFFVSFMKSCWGKAATAENNWAYDYLPKRDVPTYDILRAFDLAKQGKLNGYLMQGFNALMTFPNRAKMTEGLSKLKFLVVMDPLQTETARFWQNHGVYNDVDPSKIETEVFELPTTCFAEDEGSLANSSRWLQWHWAAAEPPAMAKPDTEIMAGLYLRLRKLYEKEGGPFPDPIVNVHWPYLNPAAPQPDEIAKEMNGYTVEAIPEPNDATKVLMPAGRQLDAFAQLRDDGKTACGCWIFSGCYTEAGNMMARRDPTDPEDRGLAPKWAFSWPANRRIMYNRASADPAGKPWDDKKRLVWWNGTQWVGYDVPDYGPTVAPSQNVGPFIMNAEGVSRLFVRRLMTDGPFPAHYEPFESPRVNLVAPKIKGAPAARIFSDDLAQLGSAEQYPYVGTSYRVTEHFHFWSKHARIDAILQPQQFVEIGEALAKEKGIGDGDWVRVWSNRGELKAKALVSKRLRPLICDGKPVYVVGIPHHWGFTGYTKKGWGPNSLTPFVGDANTQTPEFKAWLVNIEPTTPPPPSPQEAVS